MPSQWTASNWVVQESGYALGRSKRVLLLIEQGVDFPTADLDADTEWIPFDRAAVSQCSSRLVSMIGNLISEKLPAVPSTTQVGAPQESVPPEEQRRVPPPGGDFDRVIELLNRGEFQQADEEFQRFLGPETQSHGDRWWRYFDLRLKSVRGHVESLQELKDVVQREPQNVDARIELAQYYSYFKNYDKAAQNLIDGVDVAPQEFKATLLRHAAEELAKDNKQEKALKIIGDLISRFTEPTELRASYLSLADVAKSQSDRELESAALEHVLDLDPSNSDTRFRLAYLYGEMENRRLSTYHYTLRLYQGQHATALNNLGVAYGALKLPSKEIGAFEKAAEESWLAKANLSHAYVDRGFLTDGEKLANEVMRADCDETERNRAIGALRRVSTIRSTEKETVEKILSEAKSERLFRSAYAEAFVASAGAPINGVFETPYGRISFKQQENRLLGEGKFEEPTFGGLLSALSGAAPTGVKVRNVKIEAIIVGRSGRFTFETDEREKATLLNVPKSETVQGLMVIAEDGESFEALEKHETRVKLYTARRAQT
jgi:tetratricopeptide (TPR) repeat protein